MAASSFTVWVSVCKNKNKYKYNCVCIYICIVYIVFRILYVYICIGIYICKYYILYGIELVINIVTQTESKVESIMREMVTCKGILKYFKI